MAPQSKSVDLTQTVNSSVHDHPVNRRRALHVLSALAAAAAGAAVLSASRPAPASATTGSITYEDNTLDPVVAGSNAGGGPGVAGFNTNGGTGVSGIANGGGTGVSGNAWTGVDGLSFAPNGYGVKGTGTGTGGTGVSGTSTGGGAGVQGNTNTGVSGSPAVAGINAGAGPGVVGYSTGTNSIGTGGTSDSGYGFYGGATGSGTGVLAYSAFGNAIWGAANSANGYSGLFTGGKGVVIYGALTVAGGPKSAAVKGADGTLRRLYCVESPESWFEDFGHSQLSNGAVSVPLEPGFAGLVKTEDYHVFLTPQGESKGWLYVSSKTPTGFTVHEAGGGTSSIVFDYRVVAKRKDITGARLEPVEEIPSIELPKLPEPPAAPLGHGR
jgi:hypothetical protein